MLTQNKQSVHEKIAPPLGFNLQEKYPIEDIPSPLPYRNLVEAFEESTKKYEHRVAFKYLDKGIMTFQEFGEKARAFASFLQNVCEFKKGDRIAIQLPNVNQYPIAALGALEAGGIVVNTNPLYTSPEMLHQFKDSGTQVIVILAQFLPKLEEIIEETSIRHVIVTEVGDECPFLQRTLINSVLRYVKKDVQTQFFRSPKLPITFWLDALQRGARYRLVPVAQSSDDIAFLQYTGGTTGVSKGAMLSHANLLSNMFQIRNWMKPLFNEGEEVILTPLPLYHIFSLSVNLLAFSCYGATNILIPNPRDLSALIKTMMKEPFTVMSGVNTLFNALLNHKDFKKISFQKLKLSVAGGMTLQKKVSENWMSLTQSVLIEGYGLTEASPVVTCNPVIKELIKVGSIGLPLPNTEVSVRNEEGRPVPRGEAGEICVRGPQVMVGYWNRPDETKKIIRDGWLHTGDIAVQDEDNYYRIVDRKKDLIIVSGFNVFPNEVEEALQSHPDVLEAAVIGAPSKKTGEEVRAFVVKKNPSILSDSDLRKYLESRLTHYKLPKKIYFRSELPKSNVGKILRRALRDELATAEKE